MAISSHIQSKMARTGKIGQGTFYTIAEISRSTISIASPAVVTSAAHGQVVGNPVIFSTTGALPTVSSWTSVSGIITGRLWLWRHSRSPLFREALRSTRPGSAIRKLNLYGRCTSTHDDHCFVHSIWQCRRTCSLRLDLSDMPIAMISTSGVNLEDDTLAGNIYRAYRSPILLSVHTSNNSRRRETTRPRLRLQLLSRLHLLPRLANFQRNSKFADRHDSHDADRRTNNTSLATTAFVTASFLTTTTARQPMLRSPPQHSPELQACRQNNGCHAGDRNQFNGASDYRIRSSKLW